MDPESNLEKARFHHVHLNVESLEKSIDFYAKVFNALPVNFNDSINAVLVDGVYIFFNEVGSPAPGGQESGIWHKASLLWGPIKLQSKLSR